MAHQINTSEQKPLSSQSITSQLEQGKLSVSPSLPICATYLLSTEPYLTHQWFHLTVKQNSNLVHDIVLPVANLLFLWAFYIYNQFWICFYKLPEVMWFMCVLASRGASQVVLVVKNPPVKAGDKRDAVSIPGSERSPGWGVGSWREWRKEGNVHPLQYSCLENVVDRGAWQATVHRVTKNWTQLKWLSVRAWPQEGQLWIMSIQVGLFSILR